MSARVDALKREHLEIREALDRVSGVDGAERWSALTALAPVVSRHLQEKESLYATISSLCTERGDNAGRTLARIFEDNMKVLSSGVRAFFEQLPGMKENPSLLTQRFETVSRVLRSRFDTEEQAVFPIHERHSR